MQRPFYFFPDGQKRQRLPHGSLFACIGKGTPIRVFVTDCLYCRGAFSKILCIVSEMFQC